MNPEINIFKKVRESKPSRRDFMKVFMGALVAPNISVAQEKEFTKEEEEAQEAFQDLMMKKREAGNVMDDIMDKRERQELLTTEMSDLYNKSFEYGTQLKEYIKKYPQGVEYFAQGEDLDIKNKFDKWYEENKKSDLKIRLERIEELITDLLEKNQFNGIDDDVARKFMFGFICGYYEGLCQDLS